MAVPVYASPIERIWYYVLRLICAAVLLFLIAPILAIMPLSFNSVPFFTYPMPGFSLRWYEDFFLTDRWQGALQNSIFVACCTTVLATILGTLAALGLSRSNFPFRTADHEPADLADHRAGDDHRGRHVFLLCRCRAAQHLYRADPRPYRAGRPLRGHHRDRDPDRLRPFA